MSIAVDQIMETKTNLYWKVARLSEEAITYSLLVRKRVIYFQLKICHQKRLNKKSLCKRRVLLFSWKVSSFGAFQTTFDIGKA